MGGLTSTEYAAAGGAQCPNCQSENIHLVDPEEPQPGSTQMVSHGFCHSCEAIWEAVFTLTGYKDLDVLPSNEEKNRSNEQ